MLIARPEAADGSDEAFLYRLFASHKLPEMAAMPLDEAGKTLLLRMQYHAMSATYRNEFPAARFDIVETEGQPIGRLITDATSERVYFVDIAILPDRQGGGVATALMRAALEEVRRLGVPGRVQVLASNAASLRLCEKLGMAAVAQEPPYVTLEWPPPAA